MSGTTREEGVTLYLDAPPVLTESIPGVVELFPTKVLSMTNVLQAVTRDT